MWRHESFGGAKVYEIRCIWESRCLTAGMKQDLGEWCHWKQSFMGRLSDLAIALPWVCGSAAEHSFHSLTLMESSFRERVFSGNCFGSRIFNPFVMPELVLDQSPNWILVCLKILDKCCKLLSMAFGGAFSVQLASHPFLAAAWMPKMTVDTQKIFLKGFSKAIWLVEPFFFLAIISPNQVNDPPDWAKLFPVDNWALSVSLNSWRNFFRFFFIISATLEGFEVER